MVTKLYYFKTKQALLEWCKARKYRREACLKAWRGPGWYYARSRSHISKHNIGLDKRRGGRIGRGPWRHTTDSIVAVARRLKEKANGHAKRMVRKALREISRREGRKPPRRLERKAVETAEAKIARKAVERARRSLSPEVRRLAEYLWRQIPKRYKRGRDRAWTYISVVALAKEIVKRAKRRDVDPYQYDWAQLIDWSLGYRAALQYVKDILGKTEEEYLRESIARWRELKSRYREVNEDIYREYEAELDAVSRYELDHLDEMIGF